MKKALTLINRTVTEKPLLALGLLFTLTRLALYALFPFRTDFLPWLNQLLDVELLKHDLWHSLYYLHVTPPLYNLFIGLTLKAFPEEILGYAFSAMYFLMGLAMVLMGYHILRYLKTPEWIAFLSGVALTLNPILFRFEIIPFYTYPLAFLILLSVFLLTKFLQTSKKSYLLGFLFTPLFILLFRNFFHILFYFIPIAVGICFFVYKTRKHLFKTALIVSILFFAIGIIPNIRNQIDYGIFSSSTWQGMQLFSMTYFVPKDKIHALVTEGAVTPLAELPRFKNPDMYYAYYKETERSGNPALNALYKTGGGNQYGNFNNWIYARTAKEYGEDTFAIMSRYPEYFVPRLANSIYMFFSFANYRFFDKTNEWLIFDGSPLHKAYQGTKYFILPALFAALFVFIIWELGNILLRAFRSGKTVTDESAVLAYVLFTLLYVFGVSNVVELAENYTARVPIDPLLILLALYLVWKGFGQNTQSKPSAS